MQVFNNIDFIWQNEPNEFLIEENRVEIITEPGTDLWQRTYYHFRNDNAPMLLIQTDKKYFSFKVKADFSQSRHRFDQCGIVLYIDCDNWLKCSSEYENDAYAHLGSVVTNLGYSDWASQELPVNIKSLWFRLSRRDSDYKIEFSRDGKKFEQMRICHLHKGEGKIRFGIYAASPEDSSFKAIFSDFELGDCVWNAHEGQPPD